MSMMSDPSRLPAHELAAALRERELRALDVTEACLARIAARDERIHAWACVDADYAKRQAAALDTAPIQGPLHGVPIGVKDIFDTAELPTEYGSPIYRGHRPVADAAAVALARAAGAIVLGKTVSTEFATYSPASTANPHDPAHTPGGSSSGSAAAVADWMVPLAFGTQTAGSITRPASYCGIVGYKPTYGTIGRAGIKLLAESLDTVGVLARDVADAALFVGALTGRTDLLELRHPSGGLTIGLCRTHEWDHVEPQARTTLEEAGKYLAASGADVRSVELPETFVGLSQAHSAIFGYETLRNLAHERRAHASELTPRLIRELEAGDTVTAARYDAAQQLARMCRQELAELMADCPMLLAPSATGEAPRGLESTGSPVMNAAWTLLHAPSVSVPFGRGAHGLPLGLQVIGPVGRDADTLAAAAWIHERLSR